MPVLADQFLLLHGRLRLDAGKVIKADRAMGDHFKPTLDLVKTEVAGMGQVDV